MDGLNNAFSTLIEFVFGWLPSGLLKPVTFVIGAAFLIIIVKLVVALVDLLVKVVDLFIPL